jgi:hypothetical protein
MSVDALQRIASAVTPAVMVSACGLLALGLDNQANRLSLRLRELARELRGLGVATRRRELVRRQVELFSRRHAFLVRALVLDYVALLAFITTSLFVLLAGSVGVPDELPVVSFALGVLLLSAMAIFVVLAHLKSRHALELEQDEMYETAPEKPVGRDPKSLS